MRQVKKIGEYRHYETCRFCFSRNIEPVIDLGYMPLAGGFLKNESVFEKEKSYPLTINFCKSCYLLQCADSIDQNTLFKDYFYFSSSIKTLTTHFQNIASDLRKSFSIPNNTFIVEIGCNDAGFITALQKNGFKTLGVDPASNIVKPLINKGYPIINAFFGEKTAEQIKKRYGKADAIYSFHTLAHIENMHDVLKGIKLLLKPEGYVAIEVHYLGKLLEEMQYDMIYHEHQFYYSLLTLQKFFAQFDMEIFHVQHQQIRAGSMTYFVQNKNNGKRKISDSVKNLEMLERKQKLDTTTTYKEFSHYIQKTKKDLLELLNTLKKKNKTIVGYGASGRGTIIMNYCDLDQTFLDYVIDDASAKHGLLTPGTHVPIQSAEILHSHMRPDYAVLFAWPFFEEVKKKNIKYLTSGGKFIVPLPEIKLV